MAVPRSSCRSSGDDDSSAARDAPVVDEAHLLRRIVHTCPYPHFSVCLLARGSRFRPLRRGAPATAA
jgi:hypothetical protein